MFYLDTCLILFTYNCNFNYFYAWYLAHGGGFTNFWASSREQLVGPYFGKAPLMGLYPTHQL